MASEKLVQLRALMKHHNVDAYIVPHDDSHSSEYIALADERLSHISGFHGSAGIAIVTHTTAYLYTDSRYWIAAAKQIEQGWELKKAGLAFKSWFAELSETLPGSKIGFDPLLISASIIEARTKFFAAQNIVLVPVQENLVDAVWGAAQPKDSLNPIYRHEDKYVGQTAQQKIAAIGVEVKKLPATSVLSAKLDEIAWILNLRGSDIAYNPVFKAYLLLNFGETAEQNSGILFINNEKVPADIQDYLKSVSVEIRPYSDIFNLVAELKPEVKVAIHKGEVNFRIASTIPAASLVEQAGTGIINRLKGVKTPTQIDGFRAANIRDGATLVGYLAWLENELVVNHNTTITEYSGAKVLDHRRTLNDLNMGLSFQTISSTGANAAIVHYSPDEHTSATLTSEKIYLLDSGAQYLDGTTDTTRTTHFGTPTAEERDSYTRVLLGNLDVQRVQWPAGSRIAGSDIDALARRHLWQAGRDYGHGTGHGVGHFLNVHEGPHGISKYAAETFVEGMVVTDEPGYYKEGEYGIRIEDDLVVVKKSHDGYLGFENLTIVPYDRNLIDVSLLTPADKHYLDTYHEQVRAKLLPLLQASNDKLGEAYLLKQTAAL